MKKRLIFAALAVAALSLSGCAALLSSIATNPSFSVLGDGSSEGIYDGQTFRITKTGTCNYTWATSDPIQLALKEDGSNAYVTGALKDPAKTYYGKITAYNKDDSTITPVEHDVPVYAWELKLYDAAGNQVTNHTGLQRGNTYVIKMVRGSTPVNKLLKGMRISSTEETESLDFTNSNSAWKVVSQTGVTCTITVPSSLSSTVITAKLGNVKHSLSLKTTK